MKKFRMTVAQYEDMLSQQGGGCAICGTTELLSVDHDHTCCGYVNKGENRACGECTRGIICRPCNSGLGFFHDNEERLMAAANYLREAAAKRGQKKGKK